MARQGFQYLSHHACLDPSAEAPETGGAGWEAVRQISPCRAGTQDPQDPVEYRTIVMQLRSAATIGASCSQRNEGRQYCPLIIRQFFSACHDEKPSCQKKNIDSLFMK